jgi:hypothetical protein
MRTSKTPGCWFLWLTSINLNFIAASEVLAPVTKRILHDYEPLDGLLAMRVPQTSQPDRGLLTTSCAIATR